MFVNPSRYQIVSSRVASLPLACLAPTRRDKLYPGYHKPVAIDTVHDGTMTVFDTTGNSTAAVGTFLQRMEKKSTVKSGEMRSGY